MTNWLQRTELLIGAEGIQKLKNAHVLVVGLGGVGAYAAEQICRAGVGTMTIVDGDVVEESNRNRQLPALKSNEGRPKAEILAERFRDINPEIKLHVFNHYLENKEITELLDASKYDYVVDAIDTLTPKAFLIEETVKAGLPLVSSLGAGGKFDPSLVSVTDISKTFNCKLARMLRKRLNRVGISTGFEAVFSSEMIDIEKVISVQERNKASTVGTISYMPPIFGCFCASVVIRGLLL
ncbi:MAG TPA: tRNA threonylcarbamoyladenosine dehydratase [Prolixibacteraceae bacterium]|nr:tRNA threonylcarbamoyladenosine dehydratase [Prolixibacteraceae bacterium]